MCICVALSMKIYSNGHSYIQIHCPIYVNSFLQATTSSYELHIKVESQRPTHVNGGSNLFLKQIKRPTMQTIKTTKKLKKNNTNYPNVYVKLSVFFFN